jgi:ABC-type Na+ efflux pump, permease component
MYNLKNVVKFEIIRTLKKPMFWVAAILLPVLLVGYVAFAGYTGYSAEKALEGEAGIEDMRVALLDESELIVISEEITGYIKNLELVSEKDVAIEKVRTGGLDVFYFVPADLASGEPVEVYSSTSSQSPFNDYSSDIRAMLRNSSINDLSVNEFLAINGTYEVKTTSFVDGEENNIIGKMVIPLVALVIFYILICLFGNRLVTATLEEKENRISEMILTSIKARTLIVGKIISLISLGFLQVFILAVPIIIGYLNAGKISVGGINISEMIPTVVFDPWTIAISILLLILSYVLFTGLCVAIGALAPTAKDANGFMGVVMILVILPIFFISSFIASTPDAMTTVLSYFPFSAPIALMIRNAVGTLSPLEAVIGIADITIASVVVIWIAIRIFQFGVIEFSSNVKIGQILSPNNWKK